MQRPISSAAEQRKEALITAAVAAHFGLAIEVLKGSSRLQYIAHARHIAMYLLRQHGLSYEGIAWAYNKTHYVPMYAHEKITDWMTIYPEIREQIQTISAQFTPALIQP